MKLDEIKLNYQNCYFKVHTHNSYEDRVYTTDGLDKAIEDDEEYMLLYSGSDYYSYDIYSLYNYSLYQIINLYGDDGFKEYMLNTLSDKIRELQWSIKSYKTLVEYLIDLLNVQYSNYLVNKRYEEEHE